MNDMNFKYSLDEQDFLVFHLYSSSKSPLIKKRRLINRLIIPLLYIAIGIFFLFFNDLLVSFIFSSVGLLWLFLYPYFERVRYRNYYKKYIKENYSGRIGRVLSVTIADGFISAGDSGSESKTAVSELTEITEIPHIVMLKIKTGQSFIIPKAKIGFSSDTERNLRELASELGIKYSNENAWAWR